MTIDYANSRYAVPPALVEAHADAWSRIAGPGAFWTGEQRVALACESRRALDCELCDRRRQSLSPFAVDGSHHGSGVLGEQAIDVAHRLVNDPGRLTRRWFDSTVAGLTVEGYVEAVSVVATAVIIDTLHHAVGLEPPRLPQPLSGAPTGVFNPNARDEGAWVPIEPRGSDAPTETHLPAVPNIARSMSRVPDAVALFFRAFMPHYRLKGLRFAISQAEAEFVAARVSALNQCFY
jgi:hypothetical protein